MELLEKDYYPIVQKWLKKSFKCFVSEINVGIENSRADIVGVKDVGGDFTGEIETIVVEVKRGSEAFATASGQAYGYKLYANRVYLADKRPDGFTEDEMQIASHLGIGLIQITATNKCVEVLSSPYYKPLTKFNLKFLYKLNLAKCQFCETFFETGSSLNRTSNLSRENISKAVKENKGLIFWNRGLNDRKEKHLIKSSRRNKEVTFERRFVCPECVDFFLSNSYK